MDGTWLTNAELKDVLLTLAKSGAPKPKKGTTLGDALSRFTTPPGDNRTSGRGGGSIAAPSSKCFAVAATVTKTQEMLVLVDAESADEAAGLVKYFGSQVDIHDSGTRYLKTPAGTKEFRVGCDGSVEVDVTITEAEEMGADETDGDERADEG